MKTLSLKRLAAVVRVLARRPVPLVYTTGVEDPTIRGATEGRMIYLNANEVKDLPDVLHVVAHELTHLLRPDLRDTDQEFGELVTRNETEVVRLYHQKGRIHVPTGSV